jgi:hypothetical protein
MSEGTVRRPRSAPHSARHADNHATRAATAADAGSVNPKGHKGGHSGNRAPKHGHGAHGAQDAPPGPKGGHSANDAPHGPKGGHAAQAAPRGPKGGHAAPHGPRAHEEDYYMQQIPLPRYDKDTVAHINRHYAKFYPNEKSSYNFDNSKTLVCYNSHKKGHDGRPRLSALVARKLTEHEDYKPTNELLAHEGDLKKFKWAVCQSHVLDPGTYPQNNLFLYMGTSDMDVIKTLLTTKVGNANAARNKIWGTRTTPNSTPYLWVTRSWTGIRTDLNNQEDHSVGFISMLLPCTLEQVDRVENPVTHRDSVHGSALQTFGLVKPLTQPGSALTDNAKWVDFKAKYGAHIFCTNITDNFAFHDPQALHVFDTYIGVIQENVYAACWYDESMKHSDLQLCRKTVRDTKGKWVSSTHCHFLTAVNQHMLRDEHKPSGVQLVNDMYTDICNKYNDSTWRNFQLKHQKGTQDFVKEMHLHYLLLLFFYAHNKPVTAKRERELTHLLETSYYSFEEIHVVPTVAERRNAEHRNWLLTNRDDITHDYFQDRDDDIYEGEEVEDKKKSANVTGGNGPDTQPSGAQGEEGGDLSGGEKPEKLDREYPSDSTTDMLRKWT